MHILQTLPNNKEKSGMRVFEQLCASQYSTCFRCLIYEKSKIKPMSKIFSIYTCDYRISQSEVACPRQVSEMGYEAMLFSVVQKHVLFSSFLGLTCLFLLLLCFGLLLYISYSSAPVTFPSFLSSAKQFLFLRQHNVCFQLYEQAEIPSLESFQVISTSSELLGKK